MDMNRVDKCTRGVVHAFAGLGALYALQLAGLINFTVNSLDISPSQASAITKQLDYHAEVINPPKRSR